MALEMHGILTSIRIAGDGMRLGCSKFVGDKGYAMDLLLVPTYRAVQSGEKIERKKVSLLEIDVLSKLRFNAFICFSQPYSNLILPFILNKRISSRGKMLFLSCSYQDAPSQISS